MLEHVGYRGFYRFACLAAFLSVSAASDPVLDLLLETPRCAFLIH